jgi:hypothetical protein
MAAPPQGSKGRLFVKKESSYGVDPTLAATNAIRFIEAAIQWRPFNRVNSPEHKGTPGVHARLDRKSTGVGEIRQCFIRPSQTLQTLPEADPIFEAAFGQVTNRTDADGAFTGTPTTTTGTTDTVGSLAVGDCVIINSTNGANVGNYVRKLTGVSGSNLTWDPALPAAPVATDTVKGCITYTPTDDLAISLYLAHKLTNATQDRVLEGWGIDRWRAIFDQNAEPMFNCSGPAKRQITTGHADFPTIPSSQTLVGTGNPPYGGTGNVFIDGTLYKVKHLEVELQNSLVTRNNEIGEATPTEVYRNGKRLVSVQIEAWADTPATLYDKTELGSFVSMIHQAGTTEGNIVAVYCPRVDFEVPDQDDPENEVSWSFTGAALESAVDAGDELTLAFA